MLNRIIIFVFLCSLAVWGNSQDYKSDFKKAAEFYKNHTDLSMKVSVKGFSSKSDLKGNLISTGSMYRSGTKYYSEVMNNVMICDGKSMILIDHENKQVIYKPDAGKLEAMNPTESIDSLLIKKKGISYKGTSGNLLEYVIASPGEIIIQTTIFIDKSTFAIKKIEYLYNQNHEEYENELYKVEVDYSSISTSKPSDDKFKITGLVEKKGKSYIGKGKIKDYQITELNAKENYIKY